VRGSTLWFQRRQAWYLLSIGAVRAPTVAGVAARAGVDPDGLAATLAVSNAAARDPAAPDPAGKPAAARRPQDQPPYWLIGCSVRPRLLYPAPVLTLGGLTVAPAAAPAATPQRGNQRVWHPNGSMDLEL
jgi:3-oxo-5alpha-steroid 4-dehydrogenase